MPYAINPLPVPTYQADDSDHSVDRSFEIRRLRRNLITLLDACSFTDFLNDDAFVMGLLPAYFLGSHEVVAIRALVRRKRVTIIAALNSVWTDALARRQLLNLKRTLSGGDRHIVLVPERAIARQPRLNSARAVANAAGANVTAEDRIAVLMHLMETGPSTLHDCASRVKGANPYSTVLAMAVEGAVWIDLNRRILPTSTIDMPTRSAA